MRGFFASSPPLTRPSATFSPLARGEGKTRPHVPFSPSFTGRRWPERPDEGLCGASTTPHPPFGALSPLARGEGKTRPHVPFSPAFTGRRRAGTVPPLSPFSLAGEKGIGGYGDLQSRALGFPGQ